MKPNVHRSGALYTSYIIILTGAMGNLKIKRLKKNRMQTNPPKTPLPPKKKITPTTITKKKRKWTNKTHKKKNPTKTFPLTFTTTTCLSDMYFRNCRLIALLKFDVGDKPINIATKEQKLDNWEDYLLLVRKFSRRGEQKYYRNSARFPLSFLMVHFLEK